MQRDTSTAAWLLAVTGTSALILGIVYLNTAALWALAAFGCAAVVCILAGSVMLRGTLAKSSRLVNADVKRQALHGFVQRFNEGEGALRKAARLLGQSRDRLPPLEPALQGLEPWVTLRPDGPRPLSLSGKSLEKLELTTIQRQRGQLDRFLSKGDETLREAADQLRADLAPKTKELAGAGLGTTIALPPRAPTGLLDIIELGRTVAAGTESALATLEKRLGESSSDYEPNQEAFGHIASAREALSQDDPARALQSTLDACRSLAGTVKQSFHNDLAASLAAADAARDEVILGHIKPDLATRIESAVDAVLELKDAPLRGPELTQRTAALHALMDEALADLRPKNVKGKTAAAASPTDPAAWRAQALRHAAALDDAKKTRKSKATYQKVKDDILGKFQADGEVSAADVGLKDASAVFAMFVEEFPDAELRKGRIVKREVALDA